MKDPNGLTFLDQTRVGSEESILRVKEGDKSGTSDALNDYQPQELSPGSRGIVRTDIITVSHSSGSQQTLDAGVHHQAPRHF